MSNLCDRCSLPLTDGYEERSYGYDAETGYHDVERICAVCADSEQTAAAIIRACMADRALGSLTPAELRGLTEERGAA